MFPLGGFRHHRLAILMRVLLGETGELCQGAWFWLVFRRFVFGHVLEGACMVYLLIAGKDLSGSCLFGPAVGANVYERCHSRAMTFPSPAWL